MTISSSLRRHLKNACLYPNLLMHFSTVGSGGARKDSLPKSPRKLSVPLASAVSSKPLRVPPEEKTSFVEDSLTVEEQKKFSNLILVSANALKVSFWPRYTGQNFALFIFFITNLAPSYILPVSFMAG